VTFFNFLEAFPSIQPQNRSLQENLQDVLKTYKILCISIGYNQEKNDGCLLAWGGLTQVQRLAKQIPTLLAISALAHGAWAEVSPEVVRGDVGIKFSHPEMVVMLDYSSYSFLHTGHLALRLARLALYSTLQYLREKVWLTFT